MSRPLPNVSEAYYMLLQEEHQREMTSEVHIMPQPVAMNSSFNVQESLGLISKNMSYNSHGGKNVGYNNNYNQVTSYSGNQNGNNDISNNNLVANRNITTKRQQLFCDHCKIHSHTAQRCYKLHGYPPGHRLYRGKRMIAASVSQEQEGVFWLEDTNA